MARGRSVPRRRKVGALLMLVGLLTGAFSVFGPQALAAPVNPGTVGGFEIDGDQSSPPGGTVDWSDFVGQGSLDVLIDEFGPDQGLQGSSKENDPESYSCQAKDPYVTPGKDDLRRAYVNTRVTGEDDIFLDLGFVRAEGGTQGSAHVNFEFNQNPVTSVCPYVGRSEGDIMIAFDFPGNEADPANISLFTWDADAPENGGLPGKWVEFAFTGAIAAEDNTEDITDAVVGGTVSARAFGEASIDLVALAEQSGTGGDGCLSFGFASIRTRASGSSIDSALQDIMGGPVDVTTCGKIVVEKVDDAGNNLAGATFGLWPAGASVPAVGAGGTRPATGSIDTCVTAADGTCTFDEVDPGAYQVAEISPPAGYAIDSDVVAVSVGFRETVTIAEAFVDPRDTGYVQVTKKVTGDGADKVDAAELAGLRFFLTTNPGDAAVSTWPPPGSTADCTLDGSSYSCVIGPVVLGTYWVNEDPATLPDGLTAGPKVAVTVDEDGETVAVDYTNTINPIDITLEKAGPDTANVGDEITYTFDVTTTGEPLTNLVLEELTEGDIYADRCDTPLSGPTKTGGDQDDWLEVGETWTWTCKHTVTLADATDEFDGALLQNKAKVTGEDSFGREVTDTDPHEVTILLPDVTVEKTPDDGVILPGEDAVFTIEVTNLGPGRANDVTLEDQLPAGISWTEDSDDCEIEGGVLTCDFGDLDDGDTAAVTVTGATDVGDCGELPNTATVSASNELEEDEGNNSDDAKITVSCADVTVVKVAQADPISAGDTAAFDITVTNLSQTTSATDVMLSDPLPGGITWTENSDDCSIAGGVLTCDFGTVEPGGTRTVTVSGGTEPADCGLLTNTATVSSSNEAEGADDNNESTDTITVNCPDLEIEKTAGSGTVSAGDDVSFTITVTNNGPGTAYGVELDDELPGDITWTDDSDNCSISGGALSCDFGDLGDDESASVTVTGTTDPADCGVLDNTAFASASNHETVDDSASITVQCPDLGITKVADADQVSTGEDVGFTITVTNDGPGTAYDTVLNDPLPAGDGVDWSIESQSGGAGCAIAGDPGAQVLTCGPIDLEDGDSFSVHVVSGTQPSGDECEGGVLNNTATADASNDDPVQATDTVEVLCPGVNLNKFEDAPIVDLGDQVGFTISVTNAGPGVAFDVEVTDDLPAGFDWSVADDSDLAGGSCVIVLGLLGCGLGDLDVGEGATIHLTAPTVVDDVPVECTDVVNVASATVGNGDDPDDSEADLRVRCPIEIQIEKDGPATALVGEEITYTFEVTNTGGEDLFDVVITDPICDDGTLVWLTQGDGDEILEKDGAETWTAECTRVIQESDPDPLPNTATVEGHDEWDRETDDSDDHEVDILHPAIEVTLLEPVCDGDVPYLEYAVATADISDEALAGGVDITFLNPDGDDFGYAGLPFEGRVLWPGAEVGPDGQALDWPGWTQLADGTWVEGDEWDWVRPEVDVLFAVNPELTLTTGYPDSSPACAGPPPPEVLPNVIPRAPQELPRTGADTGNLMLAAGGLLILGGLLVASSSQAVAAPARRRRRS